jgi:tetratricopeptide (TPR) repeat protein
MAEAGRARSLAVLLAAALAAGDALAAERAPRAETPAAREQARLCERKSLEEGAAACRAALALGIGPERRGPVREMLAKHLTALEEWDELAELLREDIRVDPTRASDWQRLGLVLLFALGEPAEAAGALQEAVRLAPRDASFRVGLALALQATGHAKEASLAFGEALRLDPAVLEGRPAARAAMQAADRGEPWP